jgi:hypothetical protein
VDEIGAGVADRDKVRYQVVFQREGHCIETIYWTGSLEETRELAKEIARRLAADDFQIIEVNTDAPGWWGRPPSFH